jgi:hypothetical protein
MRHDLQGRRWWRNRKVVYCPAGRAIGQQHRRKERSMKTVRTLPIKLTEHDEEQIAVALMLNPHISTQADLIRAALELYTGMSADAPKIEKARKEYRKAQATK